MMLNNKWTPQSTARWQPDRISGIELQVLDIRINPTGSMYVDAYYMEFKDAQVWVMCISWWVIDLHSENRTILCKWYCTMCGWHSKRTWHKERVIAQGLFFEHLIAGLSVHEWVMVFGKEIFWGLIYNPCVRTKWGLREAYAVSHSKVLIYSIETNTTGGCVHLCGNSDPCVQTFRTGG